MLYENLIVRVISKFILPYIVIFSIYILLNGEVSPGGGFQAGAILATAFASYDLISKKKITSDKELLVSSSLGIMLYLSIGFVSILTGYNYLNYYALSSDRLLGQFLGIFIIEAAVAITVTSTLLLIYNLLSNAQNE
jgi:multicomponent Na+:H+ antiporter subunit B